MFQHRSSFGFIAIKLLFFTALEMMVAVGIMNSIPRSSYRTAYNLAYQMQCENNLKQIGLALQMYDMTNGRLPNACFFPKNPKSDPRSIVRLLSDVPAKCFVNPCAPRALQRLGLTFLWNDSVSNRPLGSIRNPSRTWLLVDMQALNTKLPKPHQRGYITLYADLSVRWSSTPPKFKPQNTK